MLTGSGKSILNTNGSGGICGTDRTIVEGKCNHRLFRVNPGDIRIVFPDTGVVRIYRDRSGGRCRCSGIPAFLHAEGNGIYGSIKQGVIGHIIITSHKTDARNLGGRIRSNVLVCDSACLSVIGNGNLLETFIVKLHGKITDFALHLYGNAGTVAHI